MSTPNKLIIVVIGVLYGIGIVLFVFILKNRPNLRNISEVSSQKKQSYENQTLELKLFLNDPYIFEDYTITLVSQNLPDTTCRDCITSATIQIDETGKAPVEHTFKSGGFAGNLPEELVLERYTFSLISVENETITLSIKIDESND